LVQCRIDPKNRLVPLQEWNDERFGESTADGVIGFERKGDMRGRVTSASKNGVYQCNKLIAKHPITSTVRLPRLLPDPLAAHRDTTHSIPKWIKLHVPKPVFTRYVSATIWHTLSGIRREEYWWIYSRFGKTPTAIFRLKVLRCCGSLRIHVDLPAVRGRSSCDCLKQRSGMPCNRQRPRCWWK
jgi:hypothetical protein